MSHDSQPEPALSGVSYHEDFACKEYLNLFYKPSDGNPNKNKSKCFHRRQIYTFLKRYGDNLDTNTARLLEFGGGPVILSLISAVVYVDRIIFAAYTESERNEIQLWKDGKEGAYDWSSHIRCTLELVENIAPGDDAGGAWLARQELLRKRINVVPCDINSDNPLLVHQEPFEMISTSLCLEAACPTHEKYKEAVQKLIKLLKPGGFIMMYFVECQTYYTVGDKKWFTLYLTLEQVKEALTEAGTTVIMAERDPSSIKPIHNPTDASEDYKALVFIAAQKHLCT